MDAGLGLVPEERGIAVRDVAVMTSRLDTGAVGVMRALRIFLRDPLHRVAGPAAEFVGAGRGHHELRPDRAAGANQQTYDYQRQHGPSCTRCGKSSPSAGDKATSPLARLVMVLCHRLSFR